MPILSSILFSKRLCLLGNLWLQRTDYLTDRGLNHKNIYYLLYKNPHNVGPAAKVCHQGSRLFSLALLYFHISFLVSAIVQDVIMFILRVGTKGKKRFTKHQSYICLFYWEISLQIHLLQGEFLSNHLVSLICKQSTTMSVYQMRIKSL